MEDFLRLISFPSLIQVQLNVRTAPDYAAVAVIEKAKELPIKWSELPGIYRHRYRYIQVCSSSVQRKDMGSADKISRIA